MIPGERDDGRGSPSTSVNEREAKNPCASFSCPDCGRPTLEATPDELTDFQCSVCHVRVREEVGK